MNTHAHLFFFVLLIFQNVLLILDNVDDETNVNNFQIAKVQPQGVAWHFLPISAWRCLEKNVY